MPGAAALHSDFISVSALILHVLTILCKYAGTICDVLIPGLKPDPVTDTYCLDSSRSRRVIPCRAITNVGEYKVWE